MNESTRIALMIESVLYESAVNGLVETHAATVAAGLSREEALYNTTRMLLQEVDSRVRLASFTAQAVALLAEERTAV